MRMIKREATREATREMMPELDISVEWFTVASRFVDPCPYFYRTEILTFLDSAAPPPKVGYSRDRFHL